MNDFDHEAALFQTSLNKTCYFLFILDNQDSHTPTSRDDKILNSPMHFSFSKTVFGVEALRARHKDVFHVRFHRKGRSASITAGHANNRFRQKRSATDRFCGSTADNHLQIWSEQLLKS